ncbi:YrhK family protein [Halodesulfovibrio spirochaetisodalis]|uniref:YrhK family protein n=1 Tax=Halodesulfovibrio spirochaetisodalis TaxID=1560234 RepID=UPI00082CBF01|nr:YrhK family protein [Halodesulfovibrio spirochaetisodalis]
MNTSNKGRLEIELGQKHIIIQRRYEAVGAFNDLLIAIWFLIGSFFFLSSSLVTDGTWLFVAGSAQLLIKPIIKLTSLIHVSRVLRTQDKTTDVTCVADPDYKMSA